MKLHASFHTIAFLALFGALGSVAHGLVCDTTLSPLSNIVSTINTEVGSTAVHDFTLCLEAGTYTGCTAAGATTLETSSGGSVAIVGLSDDPSAVVVDCVSGRLLHGDAEEFSVANLTIENSNQPGAILASGGSLLTLINVIIRDGDECIVANSAEVVAVNCQFVENAETAIQVSNSVLFLYDVFVRGNTATVAGGGVSADAGSVATMSNLTCIGNESPGAGGCVYVVDGDLTLNRSSLTGNVAIADGGAVYLDLSTGTVSNCTFRGNAADDGTGVSALRSSVHVQGCVFVDNTGANAGSRGALHLATASFANVSDCQFSHNFNLDSGAAIGGRDAALNVTRSVFLDNSVGATSGDGGAIYLQDMSPVSIVSCEFEGNYAGRNGPAVRLRGTHSIIVNSSFVGNRGVLHGALYSTGVVSSKMRNCYFAGNSASDGSSDGGGMIFRDGTLVMNETRFDSNTAQQFGSGLYLLDVVSANLHKCTFDGNSGCERGGGLYISATASATISESTFYNNSVSATGSALCVTEVSDVTLTNTYIYGNDGVAAVVADGNGWLATLTLVNSTVRCNTAVGTGAVAGVLADGSSATVTLTNSRVFHNFWVLPNGTVDTSYGGYPDTVLTNIATDNSGQVDGYVNIDDTMGPYEGCFCALAIGCEHGGGCDISSLSGSGPHSCDCAGAAAAAGYPDGQYCQLSRCGDGVVVPDPEECDDGNSLNNDTCSSNCTIIYPPTTSTSSSTSTSSTTTSSSTPTTSTTSSASPTGSSSATTSSSTATTSPTSTPTTSPTTSTTGSASATSAASSSSASTTPSTTTMTTSASTTSTPPTTTSTPPPPPPTTTSASDGEDGGSSGSPDNAKESTGNGTLGIALGAGGGALLCCVLAAGVVVFATRKEGGRKSDSGRREEAVSSLAVGAEVDTASSLAATELGNESDNVEMDVLVMPTAGTNKPEVTPSPASLQDADISSMPTQTPGGGLLQGKPDAGADISCLPTMSVGGHLAHVVDPSLDPSMTFSPVFGGILQDRIAAAKNDSPQKSTFGLTHMSTDSRPESVIEVSIEASTKSIPMEELEYVKDLGKGAFGIVKLYNWRRTPVAVKQMIRLKAPTPREVQSAVEEAQLLCNLRTSPYVVAYRGVVNNPFSIVTEYMPGGDLKQYLKLASPRPLRDRARAKMARHIALGLLYLHEEGVAHRDLKPENVLLSEFNEAKLADFGLSGDKERNLQGAGTRRYCAPEVLEQFEADMRSDIYSFGCLLIQVLYLLEPFHEDNYYARQRNTAHPPVDFDSLPPYDDRLVDVIKACCQHNPDDRPTIHAVVDALQDILIEVEESTLSGDPTSWSVDDVCWWLQDLDVDPTSFAEKEIDGPALRITTNEQLKTDFPFKSKQRNLILHERNLLFGELE